MRFRHKLALIVAAELICLGLVGRTGLVQTWMTSQLQPEGNPLRSFSQAFNIGLTPYLYCFIPAFLLVLYVCLANLWRKLLVWIGYKRPYYS
jgi:hypothetical protein